MSFRARAAAAATAVLVGVATLTALGTASGGAPAQAAAPTTSAPRPTPHVAPVHWKPCKDAYLKSVDGECGLLTVPLDHARPNGRTVQVAVSRVLHTKRPYRGALFTNAGGPGGDGSYLAAYGQYVPNGVGKTYDWYGFTPRGVGGSKPTLSCDRSIFGFDRRPYVPSNQKILHYWLHKTSAYARSCKTGRGHVLLDHLRTTDEVGDYETLRQSIDARKVTFLGFSYGTYVAQVYATLHPGSLKAVIMDGVIDPTHVFFQSNLDQDRAFQITIRRFFGWMAKHRDVFHVGSSAKKVEATYDRLHLQLTRHPAKGELGPSELDDAILPAAYYNLTWQAEGQAFAALAHGKPRPMIAQYRANGSPGDDTAYAAYLGTECTDARWPDKTQAYLSANKRVDRTAPFYTWANGWYNQPCQAWPAKDGARVKVSGAHYHGPMLLLSEQYDGATPYSGALKARSIFRQARLVESRGGTSHAVSFYSACPLARIAHFLASGAVPPRKAGGKADATCPGLAPPAPTTSRAVARQALSSPPSWLLSTTSH